MSHADQEHAMVWKLREGRPGHRPCRMWLVMPGMVTPTAARETAAVERVRQTTSLKQGVGWQWSLQMTAGGQIPGYFRALLRLSPASL